MCVYIYIYIYICWLFAHMGYKGVDLMAVTLNILIYNMETILNACFEQVPRTPSSLTNKGKCKLEISVTRSNIYSYYLVSRSKDLPITFFLLVRLPKTMSMFTCTLTLISARLKQCLFKMSCKCFSPVQRTSQIFVKLDK